MSTRSKLRDHQRQIDMLWLEYDTLFKQLNLKPEIREKIEKEYRKEKQYHIKEMERIAESAWGNHPQRESIIQRIRNLFKS